MNMNDTVRSKRTTRTVAARCGVLALVALLSACSETCVKDSEFFAPQLGDVSLLPDIDRPMFSGYVPLRGITDPLRVSSFSFDFDDRPSSNGALVSGIDTANLRVSLSGGQSIGLTRSGNRYTGSLQGVPDGMIGLTLRGRDKAGNETIDTANFRVKNSPPVVALTMTPPATQQSSAQSLDVWVRGTINDPYFNLAVGAVTRPGTDNTCGTADDTRYPEGSDPGLISRSAFDYTMSVRQNGTFAIWYTAYNPVLSGGSALTQRYCMEIRASDTAKNGMGAADPNTIARVVEASVSWQPPLPTTGAIAGTVTMAGQGVPGVTVQLSATGVFRTVQTAANGSYRFDQVATGSYAVSLSGIPSNVTCTPSIRTVGVIAGSTATADFTCSQQVQFTATVTGSWRHFVGFSMICWQVATSPAQPNAAFSTTVSGPVVQSGSSQSGSLSASGTTSSSANIGDYGAYTVATTILGRLFSGVINVDGGPGTCQ